MKRKKFPGLLLAGLLLLSGCGYTTSSALPAQFRTVYVEPFKNSIDFTSGGDRQVYFPLLEVKSREAVINRFLLDGRLRLADPGQGDMVLGGELIQYTRDPLRYTDDNDVLEYRVQVIVRLVMNDRSGEILWEEPRFAGEATYFVSGSQVTSEDSAVQAAIRDLARRVVERTIENW